MYIVDVLYVVVLLIILLMGDNYFAVNYFNDVEVQNYRQDGHQNEVYSDSNFRYLHKIILQYTSYLS